jgi:glycosyltransferase involved in cell wall biosynthesis
MVDFEVVVVDGASTDDTWKVCMRYAAADSRVRVFRDEVNAGPVRGWWRCVEEARGRFATFLWSDDLLLPTFLESTLPVLKDKDVGFVFTAAEIGPTPGTGTIHFARPSGVMPSQQFIEASLPGDGQYPVSPACALFRLADIRESFRLTLPTSPETDLTATGAGTDLLLYLLTASRYPRIASLQEALAFFREHAGSITVQGHGGQVALGYALSRSWFAATTGRRDLARAILAQHWLSEMRTARRATSPSAASARYCHVVSARELLWTAPIVVLRKAIRVAVARIRRQGSGRAHD